MKKSEKEQLFEKVTTENRDRIFRICRSWLNNPSELPDLYQEILIGIWNALDRFRNEASWSTYIYRISVNTAIKYKTKLTKNPEVEATIPEIADHDGTEEALEKEKKLTILHHCIRQLNDQDRMLISLVLEDLSYKEIAEVLDSNVNHIGVKINRAKQRISKLIQDQHGSF